MASCLPDNPSIDRIRADARRLQRAVRVNDPAAIALLQRWHPHPTSVATADFPLNAAQLTVARRYGFAGWPALVHYLQLAADLSRDPSAADDAMLTPADQFCALACLRYDQGDEPPRWTTAARLLADDPALPDTHIWAAAAAHDESAVRRMLAADPRTADAEGGPHRWPPLMYLTYSRLLAVPAAVADAASERAVLAVAEALLNAGANPNAGYLWCGLSTPFTVLTGAFGEGEQGPGRQPRHPHSVALARLLLQRGADANDGQALYNRMFTTGSEHLELLFEFGLGTGDGGPWRRRLGEATESPAEMLRRQLDWAIDHQMTERVRLLTQLGVDLTTPSADSRVPRDRVRQQDWQAALAGGRNRHPDLIHWAPDAGAVARIASAGFDVNVKKDGRTALHRAAWEGDTEKIRALLTVGADPSIVSDEHSSTALGWAEYAYQTEAAELLRAATPTDSVD